MQSIRNILFVFISILTIVGCNVINPAEKAPTYIRIDSFQFVNPNPQASGTSSNKITSAWVYFNNQPVGVFDIPGIIPVLADGPGQIQINPGVTFGGINNFQVNYPFYKFDSISITPNTNQTITFAPKTGYLGAANFRFIEDFEVGNKFLKISTGIDTGISQVTKNQDASKVFEGGGSGYIYMTSDKPNCEVINNTDFYLPQGQAYIELNYKCSADFSVGLEITAADGTPYIHYALGFKPNANWNKVYIGLQDILTTYASYKPKSYRVMIKSALPSGSSDAYVSLDNIKVISF